MSDSRRSRDSNTSATSRKKLPVVHSKIDLNHLDKKGRLKKQYCSVVKIEGKKYSIYKEGRLGSGSFGNVYLAQGPDGRWIALKELHKIKPKAMAKEIANLKSAGELVCHATVEGKAYIGMNLHVGNDCNQELETNHGAAKLAREQQLLIAKRMLKGVADLHNAKAKLVAKQKGRTQTSSNAGAMLHRDIKLENMVITPDLQIRQIDLGLAKSFEQNTEADGSTNKAVTARVEGTPGFIAPEVLDAGNNPTFNEKTEVFALGQALKLASGAYRLTEPESTFWDNETIKKVKAERVPGTTIDPDLDSLLQRMTDPDPANRPTINEAYRYINKLTNFKSKYAPQAVKVAAVSIQDIDAMSNEERQAFANKLRKQGVNSIALTSTSNKVDDKTLIRAQQLFKEAGILQIAPDLFIGEQKASAIAMVEGYYNATFGTAYTAVYDTNKEGILSIANPNDTLDTSPEAMLANYLRDLAGEAIAYANGETNIYLTMLSVTNAPEALQGTCKKLSRNKSSFADTASILLRDPNTPVDAKQMLGTALKKHQKNPHATTTTTDITVPLQESLEKNNEKKAFQEDKYANKNSDEILDTDEQLLKKGGYLVRRGTTNPNYVVLAFKFPDQDKPSYARFTCRYQEINGNLQPVWHSLTPGMPHMSPTMSFQDYVKEQRVFQPINRELAEQNIEIKHDMTDQAAEDYLKQQNHADFVLRDSRSKPGEFVLSYVKNGKTYHKPYKYLPNQSRERLLDRLVPADGKGNIPLGKALDILRGVQGAQLEVTRDADQTPPTPRMGGR